MFGSVAGWTVITSAAHGPCSFGKSFNPAASRGRLRIMNDDAQDSLERQCVPMGPALRLGEKVRETSSWGKQVRVGRSLTTCRNPVLGGPGAGGSLPRGTKHSFLWGRSSFGEEAEVAGATCSASRVLEWEGVGRGQPPS